MKYDHYTAQNMKQNLPHQKELVLTGFPILKYLSSTQKINDLLTLLPK